jgi:hypothetical protein
MSTVTSGTLAAALNHKIIQEQFDIVRPEINGLIALASMGTATQPYEGSKISWLNMGVGADTVYSSAAYDDAVTTIVLTEAKARPGMLLLTPNNEFIYVSAVNGASLTVQRGVGGSTAAAIAQDAAMSVESVSREENSGTETDYIYQPEDVENYFQTMDTAIGMSRRALATLQYGNTNDLSFQVNERIRQLAIQMNKTLMRGRKMEIGTGKDKRTFTGGLGYFFDQPDAISVDNAAGALTLSAINNLQAEVKKRGGTVDSIVVSIEMARKLQTLVNAEYQSQRLGDFVSDQGGLVRLPSDLPQIGGASQIVIDTAMRDDELYLVNAMRMTIVPMANGNAADSGNWRTLDATQPGQDGQTARIIGDFAMEIRDSNTHFARLTNIA